MWPLRGGGSVRPKWLGHLKNYFFAASLTGLVSDLKNKISYKTPPLVKPWFSLILYPWIGSGSASGIRIRIHGPKCMRIRPDSDPDPHYWKNICQKLTEPRSVLFFYLYFHFNVPQILVPASSRLKSQLRSYFFTPWIWIWKKYPVL